MIQATTAALGNRCRMEGRKARLHGTTSAANPYLQALALPSNTGENADTWFLHCDDWWRGWDEEDVARGHVPGLLCS